MNSDRVFLGPPPLPPHKKTKMTIFPNFLKSHSSATSSSLSTTSSSSSFNEEKKQLNRKYSLRKKHSLEKNATSTYKSFGKDLYDGGPVVFRNSEPYEVKFLKRGLGDGRGSGDLLNGPLRRSRPLGSSTNSLFSSFSRSHSDGNLSSLCSTELVRYSAAAIAYRNQQNGFTRYFRVLGGSWKNLLTRELVFSCIL